MEQIESFKVDHRYITPGVYLSRTDGGVKTLDLRFKKPNAGSYLSNLEMHSLEHLFATYVRNFAPENVLYFGPMGCRTGFYLLVQGLDDEEIKALIKKTLEKIVYEADEMFGMDDNGQVDGAIVYHAGTKYENGKFYTNGGRVLGVTATAATLDEALEKAYAAVDKISFEGMHFRHDIGRTK